MLQIILLILKIIGLILLAVVGLVLGLIILVLAAPVCYRVSGCWKEEKQVHIRVSWLYHIVGVMIDSNGQAPQVKIRIFGKVLGQEKEKKKKPEQKKKKTETISSKPPIEVKKREEADTSQEKTVKAEEKPVQKAKEPVKTEEKSVQKAKEPVKTEEKPVQKVKEPMKEEESSEPIILSEEEVYELEKLSRESETLSSANQENKKSHPKKKKTVKSFEQSEEEKTNPVLEMAKTGWDFIQNPNVKKLLKKLWKSVCRILRHILPRKLNVKARLGFEDPALNGKIAEAAAFLYAYYPKQFELVSDFEEEIIEVEGDIRGWLVPGYLLLAVIGMGLRVVLSKECRMLYKNIKAKREIK